MRVSKIRGYSPRQVVNRSSVLLEKYGLCLTEKCGYNTIVLVTNSISLMSVGSTSPTWIIIRKSSYTQRMCRRPSVWGVVAKTLMVTSIIVLFLAYPKRTRT